MKLISFTHPILFSAYIVISLFSFQKYIVPIRVAFPFIAAYIFIALILLLLNKIIFKNLTKAAVSTSVIFILSLLYRFFYFFIEKLNIPRQLDERIYFGIWLLLLLIFLIVIFRTKSKLIHLSRFLFCSSIFFVGFNTLQIFSWLNYSDSGSQIKSEIVSKCNENPDIYYIILDAYAGNNILKKYYNFDNLEILEYFKNKHFFIVDKAFSNYSFTELSIASALNFEYLNFLSTKENIIRNDRAPIFKLIENNEFQNILENCGYSIIKFSSGYDHTDSKNANFYFSPILSLSTFSNSLINSSPLAIFANKIQNYLHRNRIHYIFEELKNAIKIKSPKFVFAHVPSPHPPFVFNENGDSINYLDNRTKRFDIGDGIGVCTKEEYIKRYIGQLKYINKLLKDFLENLLSNIDRTTIIIIQGDHGPRSSVDLIDGKDASYQEAMSTLMTCYFSDEKYESFYSSISPINLFRVILKNYFSSDIELIRDRSYFSSYNQVYNFIDVTELLENN